MRLLVVDDHGQRPQRYVEGLVPGTLLQRASAAALVDLWPRCRREDFADVFVSPWTPTEAYVTFWEPGSARQTPGRDVGAGAFSVAVMMGRGS